MNSINTELLAGAHVSIAGGLHKAFERATLLNCRAIQIFLKNSNQWRARILTEEDASLFREAREQSAIQFVTAHDSYLINLASPDRVLRKKSLDALIEEMQRANFLGVNSLVIHPGAHMGAGIAPGVSRISKALKLALDTVEPPVKILLENTAGQGTCIGHRFEHLAAILEQVQNPARAGVCLDTCHMFAAGYDIRTAEAYAETMQAFDRLIGVDRISVFHLNDSKKDLGSRVDRHAHIGQGLIGLEAFRLFLNDSRFLHIPKILETPPGPSLLSDLSTLHSLFGVGPTQV